MSRLAALELGADVVGVGAATVARMGKSVAGLREPPCLEGRGVSIPASPAALWCWLRGDDRGALVHRGREIANTIADAFVLDSVVDSFRYDGGRDLTGYEDGTENPKGPAAIQAAFAADGSSFVAVQRWSHDLSRFAARSAQEQDEVFGRRRTDNEEMADAPASAHVKRTAQESFEPAAFVLRRSMPWADGSGEGLVFVAFGRSFEAFEAQLRRMVGLEDGIVDALFGFTRPLSTSYFWCPPVRSGKLDLQSIL